MLTGIVTIFSVSSDWTVNHWYTNVAIYCVFILLLVEKYCLRYKVLRIAVIIKSIFQVHKHKSNLWSDSLNTINWALQVINISRINTFALVNLLQGKPIKWYFDFAWNHIWIYNKELKTTWTRYFKKFKLPTQPTVENRMLFSDNQVQVFINFKYN